MIKKLVLGTAGLGGLAYGRQGRVVTRSEAISVLCEAYEYGIRHIDVAPVYGISEEIVGSMFRGLPSVTIFTKNNGDKEQAFRSIELLGKPVFLWHNLQPEDRGIKLNHTLPLWTDIPDWQCPFIPHWIEGATCYPDDFERLDRAGRLKHIQCSWNILSQTWQLKREGRKFIARSIFLQGVLCGEPAPPGLDLAPAERLAKLFGVDLKTLALRAALENEDINLVCVGPTTLDELKWIIDCANGPTLGANRYLPLINLGHCKETDPRQW